MFDPSEVVYNGRYLWVCRYCSTDYVHGSPLRKRLNPLRYEIGIRANPKSGPRWRINPKGRWAIKWANLIYRLRHAGDRR